MEGITYRRMQDLVDLHQEVRRTDLAQMGAVVNWAIGDPKQIRKLAKPQAPRKPVPTTGPLAIPKRRPHGDRRRESTAEDHRR